MMDAGLQFTLIINGVYCLQDLEKIIEWFIGQKFI